MPRLIRMLVGDPREAEAKLQLELYYLILD